VQHESRDCSFWNCGGLWPIHTGHAGKDGWREGRAEKRQPSQAQKVRLAASKAGQKAGESGQGWQAPQGIRGSEGLGSQDEAAAAQMSVKSKDRGTIPILPYGDDYVFRDPNRYPWPFPSAGRESGAVGSSSPGGLTRRPPRRSK